MTTEKIVIAGWRPRALSATRNSQFGAILDEALRVAGKHPAPETERTPPCFHGRATQTSDGFLMCNFTGRDGRRHMGAFVGSRADLEVNINGIIRHLALNETDAKELREVLTGWVGKVW